jgi:hypothetical protein
MDDDKRKPASGSTTAAGPRTSRRTGAARDTQPPNTGANRGSPAAPVMKQFAKTRAESGGKP